jgi:hypothetical protein
VSYHGCCVIHVISENIGNNLLENDSCFARKNKEKGVCMHKKII